jgi:hypothetical protein
MALLLLVSGRQGRRTSRRRLHIRKGRDWSGGVSGFAGFRLHYDYGRGRRKVTSLEDLFSIQRRQTK